MSTPPPIPPLANKIVVEPLAEERLTNIERMIVSRAVDPGPVRLQALTRWMGLALAVGATAIAAGTFGWLAHGRAGRHAQVAGGPMSVHTEGTGSTVDIGDATIATGPNTAFAVTRPDGGVLVDLTRGRVELEVGKRGGRPPLVVHAGDTDVIVVGTHFVVDYGNGDGATDVDVRVQEGRVKIVRNAHELVVGAGQEWTSKGGDTVVAIADGPGAPPTPGQPAPGTPDSPGTTDTPSGTPPTHDPTPTPPPGAHGTDDGTVHTRPGFEVHVGTQPQVLHEHVAAVPDPHAKKPSTRPAEPTSDKAPPIAMTEGSNDGSVTMADGRILSAGEAKREAELKANPALEVLTAIKNVPLPPLMEIDGTREPTALAGKLLAASNDGSQSTSYKSKALYSLAQLQATRLFRTDDALNTIDQYLRRFERGPERADALWLRLYIQCYRSIRNNKTLNGECREAARIYGTKAPDGAGAHVAELITATPQ